MSRFSKADAEKLGWTFYHDSEEVVLRDGDNELGTSRKVPASLRAEKYIDLPGVEATRTTEEAPTIGLLLERINAYEEFVKSRKPAEEPDARESDLSDEDLKALEGKQEAKQNSESERVAGKPDEEPAEKPKPKKRSKAKKKKAK